MSHISELTTVAQSMTPRSLVPETIRR